MKWVEKVLWAIDDHEYIFRNIGKSLIVWGVAALIIAVTCRVANGGIL